MITARDEAVRERRDEFTEPCMAASQRESVTKQLAGQRAAGAS